MGGIHNKELKKRIKHTINKTMRNDQRDLEYIFKYISSTTSRYQASMVLDYYIRNMLANDQMNVLFPTEIKQMIIKLFFSYPIPNVLLFLSDQIKKAPMGTGGLDHLFNYYIPNKSDEAQCKMHQARKMLFNSKQILDCTVEDIENKIKHLELSSDQCAWLIKYFFSTLSKQCYKHTCYGGLLGNIEIKEKFESQRELTEIKTNEEECAKYVNSNVFVPNAHDNMDIGKILYWFLMDLFGFLEHNNCTHAIPFDFKEWNMSNQKNYTKLGLSTIQILTHKQIIESVVTMSMQYKAQTIKYEYVNRSYLP